MRKCPYCGFWSRGGKLSPAREEAYTASLIARIKAASRAWGRASAEPRSVDTVYIGGGTPTVFSHGSIGRVLAALREAFDVDEGAEVSCEANPGTLTDEKLGGLLRAGVNRLSIGAQSFDDSVLWKLGRIHMSYDTFANYSAARMAGFENINLDLMSGLPGLTMDSWEDTLTQALAMEPEHISFYSLQIEEGTPFYQQYRDGGLAIPDLETDRAMYHRAAERLRAAGYKHYEISNAALPGYECRHNLKYWSLDEYLGIGESAASYICGFRLREAPGAEVHRNSEFDDMSEFVFTGLRKASGISRAGFAERFGRDLWEVFGSRRDELREYFERGLLIEDDDTLRLSEAGIDHSNSIMSVFV